MNWLRFVLAIAVLWTGGTYVNARQETPGASKQETQASATRRPHFDTATCDAQLGAVCVLTLERLRKEDRDRGHAPIGVKQGQLVVWVATAAGEEFRLNAFKQVQCDDETKEIKDPKDPGPFQKGFLKGRYGPVKYAKVTGKVGNCYKHMIDVNHGEPIDPHIMIEAQAP